MPELNDLDSILASLPPDPTQGLEVLYKKLRERVTYASKVDRRSSIEEFIVCISAWVTTHYPDEYTPDIDYISSFNTEQIESVFSTTEDTAVSIIGRHKSNILFQKVAAIASGDNNFVGWAKLRDSEKNILRQHVDKIKIIITSSDIDEKKRTL
ncbi:MAG: hypothetical protein LDL39_07375 [Magnetospirillum sp.]|nr:hypothetical protein [Magnetospirillum sp.]